MNANKRFAQAALIALSFAVSAAYATEIIPIDPDGALGSDPTKQVSALGWNNAFTIAVNALPVGAGQLQVGQTFTTFGHGSLANFNNAQNKAIGGLGLNSNYEWTYVFGVTEVVTAVSATGATFATLGTGINFFDVYYDPSQNSDMLSGTGFNDGQLILSGTFLPYNSSDGTGVSAFTVSSIDPNTGQPVSSGALDTLQPNNYPGINSVAGAGSFNFLASITSADLAFFPTAPSLISVTDNGFTNLPFKQTDPSSCYFNGSALTSAIGQNSLGTAPATCLLNTVGTTNGLDGPNFAFETRATSAFNTRPVPEPASLALLGLGLGVVGWTIRRRRS